MGRLITLFSAIALMLCVPTLVYGQLQPTEKQIKAAFLYKFGGFVEWPARAFPSADTPFMIAVVGSPAIAEEVRAVTTGRTVQGRPVLVRSLRRGETAPGAHVLFVGDSEAGRLQEILTAVKDQPVLVVTEWESALSQGSMINFVAIGDKVRFDVALPPAEREQLKISARLLAVARKVIGLS